jgi:hypothetical protein
MITSLVLFSRNDSCVLCPPVVMNSTSMSDVLEKSSVLGFDPSTAAERLDVDAAAAERGAWHGRET